MDSVRKIELLAPARDLQTGIEAIRHGADAVYIGAPKFGARSAAGNAVDDIRQLVDYARPYGVKIYVTLNTILYDSELEEAYNLVDELSAIGVDALIVQDLSLVRSYELRVTNENKTRNSELRTRNSELGTGNISLHASTQMDNRTAEKVAWLRDLGFEQVVLARELTLDEIREIHRQVPDVRLEAFVHGAICVSYNGQCYASQHCFGRSANRGECAQFCRLPFDLLDEEGHVLQRQKHLLSLRDMNRSADLEAMLDAGITSLKIEGRLKDIAYVKNVVAYYRQRLDEIFRRRTEYQRSSLGHEVISFTPNPAKSFNRLFTDYFLHGRTPDMAHIYTPKSMGEPVGFAERRVGSATTGDACIVCRNKKDDVELHNGDGLCFINDEGQLVGFRANRVEGNKIIPTSSHENLSLLSALHTPRLLYRNLDHAFEQLLSKPTATRKVGVQWLLKETDNGFLLRLTREDGALAEQTFPYAHELARSPQKEPITRQLSRLGDTPYEATGVEIQMSQNWFIPSSILADWRRKTLHQPSLVGRKTNVSFGNVSSLRSPLSTLHQENEPLTYLANVANHVARKFYLDQGAKQVDWALEVEQPKTKGELLIMTCRYCIRHELGMCKAPLSPPMRGDINDPQEERKHSPIKGGGGGRLFLRLTDGRCFRLHFDCRNCQMLVYG